MTKLHYTKDMSQLAVVMGPASCHVHVRNQQGLKKAHTLPGMGRVAVYLAVTMQHWH
jgi:hypothetical protein